MLCLSVNGEEVNHLVDDRDFKLIFREYNDNKIKSLIQTNCV